MAFCKNIFIGNNLSTKLALVIYNLLISREWITIANVLDKFEEETGRESTSEQKLKARPNYESAKTIFNKVRKTIKQNVGKECFEVSGNNRNRSYKYVGTDNDPLAEMRAARVKKDIHAYWNFCQDSSDFFPISWFEYFFKGCLDLLEIKEKRKKGEQIMDVSTDRMLANIDQLPMLYEVIKQNKSLHVVYKPFGKDKISFDICPHLLKEYNGRWFVLGQVEKHKFPFIVSLDRIVEYNVVEKANVCNAENKEFILQYINDRVGVTHEYGAKKEHIIIRTKSEYLHGLLITKPFHHSQNESLTYGIHGGLQFGEITLDLEPNREFMGQLRMYGDQIEVISPESLRIKMKDMALSLLSIYNKV